MHANLLPNRFRWDVLVAGCERSYVGGWQRERRHEKNGNKCNHTVNAVDAHLTVESIRY